MKPSDYYRRLSASIKEADVRLMAAVMSEHVGQQNAIRMDDLCQRVSIKDERKVRIILAKLVMDYGWPVGAISGKTGRWLIATEQERQEVLSDLGSRVSETQARIRALQNAKLAPPEPLDMRKVQPAMFDMPEPEPDRLRYWR